MLPAALHCPANLSSQAHGLTASIPWETLRVFGAVGQGATELRLLNCDRATADIYNDDIDALDHELPSRSAKTVGEVGWRSGTHRDGKTLTVDSRLPTQDGRDAPPRPSYTVQRLTKSSVSFDAYACQCTVAVPPCRSVAVSLPSSAAILVSFAGQPKSREASTGIERVGNCRTKQDNKGTLSGHMAIDFTRC